MIILAIIGVVTLVMGGVSFIVAVWTYFSGINSDIRKLQRKITYLERDLLTVEGNLRVVTNDYCNRMSEGKK